jgi:hypothetical protein
MDLPLHLEKMVPFRTVRFRKFTLDALREAFGVIRTIATQPVATLADCAGFSAARRSP